MKRPTGPTAPERLPDLIQITSCLARLGCGEEEIWRIVTSWSDSPRSPVVRQVRENPDLSRTLTGAAA